METAAENDSFDHEKITACATKWQALIIAVRRVVRRHSLRNLPELPASETELLTLVSEEGRIGIVNAARLMQVSPTTVSTLVKSLVGRGLLERLPNSHDKRGTLLQLTPAGMARKDQARRQRLAVMTSAMLTLDENDRRVLEQAIPSMEKLLSQLEIYDASR